MTVPAAPPAEPPLPSAESGAAAIDAATVRPVACGGMSADECIALAQDGGW